MRHFVILGCVILFLIFLIILGIIEDKKRKAALLDSFKNQFGKFAKTPEKKRDYSNLKEFHKMHSSAEAFSIDSITVDDLSIDSIFQKMNTCVSSAGEEVLYHRLQTLRTPEEETNLEKAVSYLIEQEKTRVGLQVALSKIGKRDGLSVLSVLEEEKEKKVSFLMHLLPVLLYVLSIILLIYKTGVGIIVLICSVFFSVISYYVTKRKILPYIESLGMILRLFKSVKMIDKDGLLASDALREIRSSKEEIYKRLGKVSGAVSYVIASESAGGSISGLLRDYFNLLFHVDLLAFSVLYDKLTKGKDEISALWILMGSLDTYISIASFRKALPYYAIPVFGEQEQFYMEAGYHMLVQKPVPNSATLKDSILLTGSNASGKSTYLRMIAVNLLLAQTIHTACAKSLCMPRLRIYSSMAIHDDLAKGDSFYMAEIKALRRVVEASMDKAGLPVICFVDEILRGTNTVERIAASTEILKALKREGTICVAATHDIELTKLLENEFHNLHFEEVMKEKDVFFSYKVKEGPATTRNAIDLLQNVGFAAEITENARQRANIFETTGEWK